MHVGIVGSYMNMIYIWLKNKMVLKTSDFRFQNWSDVVFLMQCEFFFFILYFLYSEREIIQKNMIKGLQKELQIIKGKILNEN